MRRKCQRILCLLTSIFILCQIVSPTLAASFDDNSPSVDEVTQVSDEVITSRASGETNPGIDSFGGLGVNDYTNCSHGSRAGKSLVQKLASWMPVDVTRSYLYYDGQAYPSRFLNASYVDLFVYSGHGKIIDNYRAAHFHVVSASNTTHSDATSSSNNASSQSTRFNHKYVAMYTCNWLNWGTTTQSVNAFSTMSSGCRQELGFATVMYLDSREGNMFGYRMVDYVEPIKTAFFESAKYYQPQNSNTVKARVCVWNSAANDTFYSGATTRAPGYASNSSQYSYYTVEIAGTGNTF